MYTNDLRVLVDVFIRELNDLPDEAEALRHTYLRVLHPLLSHTQLRREPHYKREALRKLFHGLKGGQYWAVKTPSPTTLRLVERCLRVSWIQDQGDDTPTVKYLDVAHLSETGSSVSLMNVAHTPKPPAGVQTPSLKDRQLIGQVTGVDGVIAQA
ncbi:Protein dip1 [Neolecta irregularis DAH-3]|uniref:Protein dip1 n=1 Tax=Neolecta irregularis (strain DAH-3) TaxID=1198029 RepID=A0A1U7LGD2_NEOID|nr:Protein dip1 [Neolecta irregularis DAH-3]|eukprot:OLL21716.1 Protein dip1 [Neolecta irregularis DAH-3]